MTMLFRKIHAAIVRYFQPLWLGSCGCCGYPWINESYHDTLYADHSACFALCEFCWSYYTPLERLPFYMQLVDRWEEQHEDHSGSKANYSEAREQIRQAVLEGK